ncbi:hypothetical protein ciss_07770 [Carboxydothermus islandicus]|uniref:Uncharacterized protein n=1 Tax=Carboxydothermus islandicus TaxID=661089 RepID=A0A1L8D128_9THEO|nr:hypothetical protein [Carboxydothermus islandicus]GAV24844.1 hypothetical protein ciss_07770 [Carboxydothermus islandicus]
MLWEINAFDVIHIGRTPGGECFSEFIDALICAQATISGFPICEIRTNLRTNIPDGGVDTEVCQPIPIDWTGWLKDTPTIWQYKATEAKNIFLKSNLRKEINKNYVTLLLKKGYAYRLCICDDMSAPEKQEWEEYITQLIREIEPNAPKAKILTASDLARWANCFPTIISYYFRPNLLSSCLHIEAWGNNITNLTPEYVFVPTWANVREKIMQHVNFKNEIPDAVLPIFGEAGVGKTRLVYECLVNLKNAKFLVAYTDDEKKANELARLLANDSNLFAILVADECGIEARMRLNELLRGSRNRVRVIAIDNSSERHFWYTPEIWLEKIPEEILMEILEKNYPEVPVLRRRAYAALAKGFVRLAADLCRNDGLIAGIGNVEPIFPHIRDYLSKRLSNSELMVLQALSLVTKVGMKGDLTHQLDDLNELIKISSQELKEVANKLHDGPGFVSKAGRFFYVTPEIIAQVGFDLAWKQWASDDPQKFLESIPQSLLEGFLKRVAKSASDTVRQTVADFFRKWANGITPRDLVSIETVDRFVTLVEMDPHTYLPTLRRIIEKGTREELFAIKGDSIAGRWGPRRSLVWLMERIAAFPEHFEDAERILLKLSLAETELRIGNNATNIWKQLFRIFLSGTAIPFLERLKKLEERIFADDREVSFLALEALDGIFTPFSARVLGPPIVAGRIPPEEWQPKTYSERKDCLDAATNLLKKIANSSFPIIQKKALEIAIKHTRFLLTSGYLSSLKTLFSSEVLDDQMRVEIIGQIQEFLHFDCKSEHKKGCPLSQNYIDEVRQWLRLLKLTDFHGRIVTIVGGDPWQHSILGDEGEWRTELHSVAIECLKYPKKLIQEIVWLCSPNAKSSAFLGEEIGKLDKDAKYLNLILDSAYRFNTANFAGGYVRGLLTAFPKHLNKVNDWIDKIQNLNPKLAYELALAGGEFTKPLQRTLQLVDELKLSAAYLQEFLRGVGQRPLLIEEFEQIFVRLIRASESGDGSAIRVGIRLVAYRLKDEEKDEEASILQHQRIYSMVWRLMEITAKDGGGESYWWTRILEILTNYEPDRAIGIAVTGLISDNFMHRKECEKFLIDLGPKYPETVMDRVGAIALDSKNGSRFFIDIYRNLIQSIPAPIIMDWIQMHGVEAARRIARHLPIPFIDDEGKAVVPPLTEFVLEKFEDDERVFREFCIGVHGIQIYTGDIALQHRKEEEIARKFLNHPLRRIREWAQVEIENACRNAEYWLQINDEFGIE